MILGNELEEIQDVLSMNLKNFSDAVSTLPSKVTDLQCVEREGGRVKHITYVKS